MAWTYNAGDADTETNRTQMQTSPIVVEGVLYGVSPVTKVFALDAATGERRWEFDPFAHGASVRRGGVSRGVTWWADGDDRRLFASGGSKLFALDADTGVPIEAFGDGGSIDLHDGLDAGRDVSDLFVISNTPGVVYRDLLILPTRNAETNPAAPGNIRAFDARTGEVRWIFRTIPHPGEYGHDTWPPDAWLRVGAANNWAGMSVDHERGLVFVPPARPPPTSTAATAWAPTSSPTPCSPSTRRPASGSGISRRCTTTSGTATSRRPPTCCPSSRTAGGATSWPRSQVGPRLRVRPRDRRADPPHRGTAVPALGHSRRGRLATQPLPVRPPPFTRQRMTEDEVTDISPEAHRYVLDRLRRMRSDGQFVPTSREGTIILPGLDGGGEWGGAAVDPDTGIMYVNGNDMPWIGAMVEIPADEQGTPAGAGRRVYGLHCVQCHGVDGAGDELGIYPAVNDLPGRLTLEEARAVIDEGRGYMPSHAHLSERERAALLAYLYDSDATDPGAAARDAGPGESEWVFAGYRRFLDQAGRPAIKPPWATLNAIDLAAGELLWKVTLGDWPELSAAGRPPTGAEAYGGPLVTASGLIFIGATRDERFRVFDTRDGALLWETGLPAAGYAPLTYAVDGRQYVAIAAGGGKIGTRSGDAYVAFALGR